MAAKVLTVTDGDGNPILPPEAETGLPETPTPSQMRPRVAKEKQPACALTEGCIKRGGHEKSRHAGEAKCSTYEQAYPDAEAPLEAPAEPVAPRKKGGLPTLAADWRGPHTAVILGRIERSVEGMPTAIRQEQRLILLAAFIRALDAGATS